MGDIFGGGNDQQTAFSAPQGNVAVRSRSGGAAPVFMQSVSGQSPQHQAIAGLHAQATGATAAPVPTSVGATGRIPGGISTLPAQSPVQGISNEQWAALARMLL